MTTRYTYACTLTWGGDEPTAELEVECTYEVAWGSPESGRYGRPEDYDPGSTDVVECIKIVSVGGTPWPVDLSYGFQTAAQDHEMLADKLADECEAEMIANAVAEDSARRDSYLEAEWRERREERY